MVRPTPQGGDPRGPASLSWLQVPTEASHLASVLHELIWVRAEEEEEGLGWKSLKENCTLEIFFFLTVCSNDYKVGMPAFNCPLSILKFLSRPAAFSGVWDVWVPPEALGWCGAVTIRKPSGYGIAFAPHFKDLSPTMRPATFSLVCSSSTTHICCLNLVCPWPSAVHPRPVTQRHISAAIMVMVSNPSFQKNLGLAT